MDLIPINSSMRNATLGDADDQANHTITFVIGFGILSLFFLMGIAASAFLCITLKKDTYLWDTENNQQLQESSSENAKERDKFSDCAKSDCTQF